MDKLDGGSIVPSIRYNEAAEAIDWLCEAFGFERHLVVPGEGNEIRHAQLVYRNGMIMLGSPRPENFGKRRLLEVQDDTVRQSIYVIVPDVDTHHARAKAAGARIEMEPTPQPHGGSLYTCRDLEGNLWNFGSYDPWTGT